MSRYPATGFGPDAVEVGARALRLGDGWCRSFGVVGYPREVGLGWLEPLTTHPGRVDVSVHIDPVAPVVAADRLRRQLARLESSRRSNLLGGPTPPRDASEIPRSRWRPPMLVIWRQGSPGASRSSFESGCT
jgi:hypothetical protein